MAYLISVCPKCDEQNFPEASYCIKCGQSLLDVSVTKIDTQSGDVEIIERHRSTRICPECEWPNPGSFEECGRCHHEFTTKTKPIKSTSKHPTEKAAGSDPALALVEEPALSSDISPIQVPKNHNVRNGLIVAFVIAAFYLFGPISDYITVAYSGQTARPSIQGIADSSGLNTKGKATFYRTDPELVNANTINARCPNSDETVIEYGCYLPKENKMYILEVSDPKYKDIEYSVAAHETLHAIWSKMPFSERQSVTNDIKAFYADNTNTASIQMHDTLKPYGSDQDVIDNELHSFIGSEVSDTYISQPLEAHYAKYFSQRSDSVNANAAFNSKIQTELASLNSEYTALGQTSDYIDAYKVKWLDSIKYYMNQASYYGDTYTYNKNVDAYNHNLINYNNQVTQYEARRIAYNKEIDSFNAMYAAFFPTRTRLNTKGQ